MDEFENMTEFSPFTWQPVYSDGTQGEVMDFNIAIDQQSQLSSSRSILETIVEETSDDEENGVYPKWSGSDSFSSGSSQTGSVVYVDPQNGNFNFCLSLTLRPIDLRFFQNFLKIIKLNRLTGLKVWKKCNILIFLLIIF